MLNKKRFSALLLALTLTLGTSLTGCSENKTNTAGDYPEATQIVLSDEGITVDGETVIEIAAGEDAVVSEDVAVYASHDIVYYEDRDTYDSGNAYGEGDEEDKHSAEEAAAHTVVNITEAGTYRLTGTLSKGQISVDLGKDAKMDPEAVVTLILDNVDINCDVAPAVIFYNVYESNQAWIAYDDGETEEYEAVPEVDTNDAGANVIIADGSVNNVEGEYVARIYKDNGEEKKLHKYDAAFYSKRTMNVNGGEKGDGVLNITASNEGLDSEMHLTINGGKINITSGNDGINTNEDNVSVTTINGGSLHIVAGLGEEGDGIDSNGYLVINGGTVIAAAKPLADSGLDADLGSYIHGGTVIATGSTMDWAESDSEQVTMNLQFASSQDPGEAIVITTEDGVVVFAYDGDQDETTGDQFRGYQGAIISSPNFEVGKTYYVYVGGDVRGSDVNGLFDPDSVTGFDGGIKQEYTGSDVGMFGPGGMGGGNFGGGMKNPLGDMEGVTVNDDGTVEITEEGANAILNELKNRGMESDVTVEQLTACTDFREAMDLFMDFEGKEPGQGGQRPDGAQMPEGMTPPDGMEMPEGFEAGQMPEGGFGGGRGQGGQGGQRPDGNANGGDKPVVASTEFRMTDKVNAFSGVCDEGTNTAKIGDAVEEK